VAASARAHETIGWKAQHSSLQTLIESTWNAYRDDSAG